MKRVLLATTLLISSAGLAFAGPGSGEPVTPADPSSGRPSAVLDDAQCSDVWSLTQRQGDTLTEGEAAPFIVNFKLVDANADGKISEAEFKDGCKKGLVQQASAGGQQQPSGTTSPMGTPKTSPSMPQ
jgi:hypothetical protein